MGRFDTAKRVSVLVVCVVSSVLMVAMPAMAEPPAIPLRQLALGDTSAASNHYAFPAAVSKAINTQTDGPVRLRVLETGSGVDNINWLRQNWVDVARVTSYNVAQSMYGVGPWHNRDADDRIRMVLAFNQSPHTVFVRADSVIEKLEDWGRSGNSCQFSRSSTAAQVKAALDTIDIEPDYKSISLEDSIAQVQVGRFIGFAESSAAIDRPDASFMRLMSRANVLSFMDEQLETIHEVMPLLASLTLPAGIYEGQTDDYRVIDHICGYVAHHPLNSDVKYHFFDSMLEQQDSLEVSVDHWPKRAFINLKVAGASRAHIIWAPTDGLLVDDVNVPE